MTLNYASLRSATLILANQTQIFANIRVRFACIRVLLLKFHKIKKSAGLSLIELIIVVFLFSIMTGAIFMLLGTARSCWKSGGSQLSVQQDARRGLNTMAKELRQARLSTISGVPADGTGYSSITFQIPQSISAAGTTWSTNIQYTVGGLNSSQLLRTQDANQRVLANNISSLSLSRNAPTPDIINIALGVQKNTFPGLSAIQTTITTATEVKVRNP